MSPLLVMSLLGLSLLIPIFEDNGTEEDGVPDPADPDPTGPVVEGTDAPDILSAVAGETLNGQEGNDTLSATDTSDGATLNGADGADSLTLEGLNGSAFGGAGADVITVTGTLEPGVQSVVRIDGGEGDDTITATSNGGVINGGGAEDVITVTGDFDTVMGGAGNDTISVDGADAGGATPIDGGAGNDVITVREGGATNGVSIVDGGSGDDRIITQIAADAPLTDITDVLTGGEGRDTFEIEFQTTDDRLDGGQTFGTLAEITDFNAAEDSLVIDVSGFNSFGGAASAENQIAVQITDLSDGSGSELTFTVTHPDVDAPLVGTLQLSGVTGLAPDAVDFVITGERLAP